MEKKNQKLPKGKIKRVTKVLMFVWRQRRGRKEFLLLYRKEQNDCVVPTGRLEENESLEEAVRREIFEELGVKPKNIVDLNFQTTVKIKQGRVLSEEHAFLVEIPCQEVKFLEYKAKVAWYSLEDLAKVLTYPNQKEVVEKIQEAKS